MSKILIISALLLYAHFSFSQNKTVTTSGDILVFALPVAAGGTTVILGDKKGT